MPAQLSPVHNTGVNVTNSFRTEVARYGLDRCSNACINRIVSVGDMNYLVHAAAT